MARLKEIYKTEIVPKLQKDLGLNNAMAVPRISKITFNMGFGAAVIKDKKMIQSAIDEMALITGQQPVKTFARKSVASFKVREGNVIGCKANLRRNKMYEMLDRLINIAIPRIQDFRGLSTDSFDGRGNYNLGIAEQIVFPEIDFEKITRVRGMNVAIITTTKKDEHAKKLLAAFNFPFK